jgi:dTDP-4-dehydrorhamnose 3,5-epimerase
MRFSSLSLAGLYAIDIEPYADDRGFFARTLCEEEFLSRGLVSRYSQSSISFNQQRGTVRGMHFSVAPHAETKVVRCTRGIIWDVVVDLRRSSGTYLRSVSIELSAVNHRALYIPAGVAHGFQTQSDAVEVLYSIDMPYVSSASGGVRWNDPVIAVRWPDPITVISQRDLNFPDWKP